MNNKFISAAAGSGKTTFLIQEAIKKEGEVLITTYTEANESEIKQKFTKIVGYIPENITIQTWFSFLLQHGVKPFQGSFNPLLFDYKIKGMLLVNSQSGVKNTYIPKSGPMKGRKVVNMYKEEEDFIPHYFSKNGKIYSDKISKFVYKCNRKLSGAVVKRFAGIYNHLMIDEVQDLAGYDLELIKVYMKSKKLSVLLVGDPRQVTYLTHHSKKHSKYSEGKIKDFLLEKCKSLIKDGIDESTLNKSHRNIQPICDYSKRLYPDLIAAKQCDCDNCHTEEEHIGIYAITTSQIDQYIEKFKPTQLGWNKNVPYKENATYYNFGESKGMGFNRVLIYPTAKMKEWILDNSIELTNGTRAKLYVGITRARYSVCFVVNYSDDDKITGVIKY